MLISSTHHSTKLPADLTYAYAAYKKGTAKIIKWLRSAAIPAFMPCSPQPPISPIARSTSIVTDCGHQSLTLDDIRALADYVVAHAIIVPEEVLFSFHTTLEARDCMTCWYQQVANDADGETTNGHLVFNAVLRGIYKDLRNVGRRLSKTPMTCCESGTCARHEPAFHKFNNLFSCLSTHCEDDAGVLNETPNWNGSLHERAETQEGTDEELGLAIKDDALERMMCLHVYQSELAQLSNLVKESHHQAGQGALPLAVTATTTRLAYHVARKIGGNLAQYDIRTPADLLDRLRDHEQQPDCPPHSTSTPFAGELITSLERIWRTLSDLKRDFQQGRISQNAATHGKQGFQDPFKWFGLSDVNADKDQADSACLVEMLYTMVLRLQQMKSCPHSGRYTCLQLLSDLDTFLHDSDSNSLIACHLTFGLHLLVTSYRAYLTATATFPPNLKASLNPRLTSLKTANTLNTSLKTMLSRPDAPCSCLKIHNISVLSQLHALQRKLDTFLCTSRFELLIQSPWISSEHIIENLALAQRYGFRAWHHGYYVGLLLHTYNALVQTGFLKRDELPVLEGLCEMFAAEVFMGCRGSAKPYTAYKRWTGGHLKFVGKDRHSLAGRREGGWDMCGTADPSKGGDKAARAFSPGRGSVFALLTNNRDMLDLEVVEKVVMTRDSGARGEVASSTTKRKAVRLREELSTSNNYAAYIATIQEILAAEFATLSLNTSNTTSRQDTGIDNVSPTSTSCPTTPSSTTPASYPIFPTTTNPTTNSSLSPALLNPYTIYILTLETLTRITNLTHPSPSSSAPEETQSPCRCTSERILSASEHWLLANRATVSTAKRTLFAEKEVAGVVVQEMRGVWGELQPWDLAWRF